MIINKPTFTHSAREMLAQCSCTQDDYPPDEKTLATAVGDKAIAGCADICSICAWNYLPAAKRCGKCQDKQVSGKHAPVHLVQPSMVTDMMKRV